MTSKFNKSVIMATPIKIYKKGSQLAQELHIIFNQLYVCKWKSFIQKVEKPDSVLATMPKDELSNANGRFIPPSSKMNGKMLTSGQTCFLERA